MLVDRATPTDHPPSVLPTLTDSRLVDVQRKEPGMTATPCLTWLGRQVGAGERTLSGLFKEEAGMS